jgi:methyl-accepting chemotaxis protein
MEPSDLTVTILREIRDEVRSTNGRLDHLTGRVDQMSGRTDLMSGRIVQVTDRVDQMSGRMDQMTGRMDQMVDRMDHMTGRLDRVERRQVESEIRLATELIAVTAAVHEVRDELRHDRAWRARVDDHERRLLAIERPAG